MGTNNAAQFSADVLSYLEDELLPRTEKQLVAYQFGDKVTMPEGRGTSYSANRYNRVPLPFAPLSEAVPPPGETMSITTVTGTVAQWGDTIGLTDVAETTVYHPPFQQAINLTVMQAAETLERNTYNALMSGTQVMYSNGRANRAALLNTDVLTSHDLNKCSVILRSIGAPQFMGHTEEDVMLDMDTDEQNASDSPAAMKHYASIMAFTTQGDLREDSTMKTAWQYSDINRLYNDEVGEWNGIRFCASNMVPSWTGVATVGSGTVGTAGNLATAANYYIQVTGSDTQNQYESLIYQVSSAITTVVGPNGSISVTVPSTAGYTYSVYIGTTASPANLGLSVSGPTTGPLQGQATQIPAGTTAVITGVGAAQVPPAAPATGVTVYPTFVFGRGAYSQIKLKELEYTYLDQADKSDPLNQLRKVGWKVFYATLILNQQFMARIESGTAFATTF